MKKMADRILKSIHITNYYHKNSGGISTAYDRLLEAANRHCRFVQLIVPGEVDLQEEVGEYGRIYYVKAKPSPLFDRRYRLLLPFHYLTSGSPIRRILKAEMPDIVEIGEKYTLSLLAGVIHRGFFRSLNRPMLVHFSCERMDDNLRAFISRAMPFRWMARRVMGNYIFPMFDYHLANSEYTLQEMIDAVSPENNTARSDAFLNLCWRFFRASRIPPRERLFFNNCGADTNTFDARRKNHETRQAILAEAGFPENATILLYVGRISKEKNIDLLPKVLNSLLKFYNYDTQRREYRLLIVGSGPQEKRLRRKLERIAPRKFKFFGHVFDKGRLADIYANSEIFLHPNPREPFGIAPLEAMASGLPVVAPKSGGILSYATQENAWLEEAHVEDYFAAIRDIFNDDSRREKKVKMGIETARTFSWDNSTSRLFALYDKMYEDFVHRRDLHVYEPEAEKIDYARELILAWNAGCTETSE